MARGGTQNEEVMGLCGIARGRKEDGGEVKTAEGDISVHASTVNDRQRGFSVLVLSLYRCG